MNGEWEAVHMQRAVWRESLLKRTGGRGVLGEDALSVMVMKGKKRSDVK